jgi:Zn-dependent oligopeptidase
MRFRKSFGVMLVLALGVSVLAAQQKTQSTVWAAKPDADAFEKVENDRLAAAQKSIDQVVAVSGKNTVENTLVPYDEALRQLGASAYFAGLMEHVHPDKAYRDKAAEMTRKTSAAITAVALNPKVYKALSSIDLAKADPTTQYYVHRQLLQFRLAGVDKDDATREKIRQLNDKSTELQSKFSQNIAEDTRSVTVSDKSELDGLPADYIERHKPDAEGKIKITTDYPDLLPVLKFAKSDSLRKKLYIEFQSRAYPANKQVLMDLVRTRDEIANTLGYASWADYNAADKMIGKGAKIGEFVQEVDESSRPIAQREFEMLLAEKRKTVPDAKGMESYESSYYSELVRRNKYNFDSSSVRPYLPYAQVKKGILDIAEKLFQLKFESEPNTPSWDGSVETYKVLDHGKMIGRFYLDMYPRAGKFTHAEMVPVLDGIKGKQLPEAVLVCNFPAPTKDDPGLMEFGDVETFFHEFGHLMHWILAGQQQWAGVSGLNMESDFVEAPSQMLENWMRSAPVLTTFAKHYKTGEPIPASLLADMKRALAFGRGLWAQTQNSYTAISYHVYSEDPESLDLDKIAKQDTEKYTPYTPVPGTYMYASFGHLAGYSSAYYTYLWDKVIAQDFYGQFDQANPLIGEAPMKYRKTVLEPGGSVSANDLVKNFLGRPQNTKAFQDWMSEEFKDTKAGD